MGTSMSVKFFNKMALQKAALLGLILCLGSLSPAMAQESESQAAEKRDLNSFFPGVLLPPTQKTHFDGLEEVNPFPSRKYSDIVLDEADLYEYYEQGEYGRAVFGLLRLARNDDPRAAETVGLMYRLGQGLPQDPEQAARWLLRAAEKHRPLAQHHLGVMHYLGEGVRMDMLQSAMWLNLAAMNYFEGPNRERALEDLRNVNLRLSSIEQARIKELVRNFLRLHPQDEEAESAEEETPASKETAPETLAPDAVPVQP